MAYHFPELQFNAPKINTPFENALPIAQLQQAQNQNKLAQMQFQKAEREDAQQNKLAGAYSDYYAQPNQDPNMLYKSLAGSGQGAAIPGVMKSMNDAAKSTSELNNSQMDGRKKQVDSALQMLEATQQIMSGVKSQEEYTARLPQLRALHTPENAAKIPDMYDPAAIARGEQQAIPLKDQLLQQQRAFDNANKERDFRQKSDEFAYRQQNDAASRGVTTRGQDMTDSRTRDLNATKVEENNIKREAKTDTANLTKQSQIASFDTMIDTLDRLSKHKGLPNATGMMNYLPDIKGSDVSNFKAELETFQSQAFIPMVSQLKGMGALSDAEGKKLTAAVGALDVDKMSEKAVRESITRIVADMKAAKNRVSGSTNGNTNPSTGGLSPAEAAELAALKKRFGK